MRGYVEQALQYRDRDKAVLDRLEEIVAVLVAEIDARGRIAVEAEPSRPSIRPCFMHDDFQEHIARAAERIAPRRWRWMLSAAGRDPMVIHEKLLCAVLFIPSIGGISRDFAEERHDADIVAGCQVLANAAASILREAGA